MRRLFPFAAIVFCLGTMLCTSPAAAQPGTPGVNAIADEGRAPYRTRFISYDIRSEADAERREGSKYYRRLSFGRVAVGAAGMDSGETVRESGEAAFEASVDIPALWLDRDVYLRDEGLTGRYLLRVNGHAVGLNTDGRGGGDYWITPALREGANRITLEFSDDIPGGEMESFTPDAGRTSIGTLFIWSQPRIHIFDYTASGHHDEEVRDAVLDLEVVVVNSYNMAETVTVGYDVYDPTGKLIEYTFADTVIPGRGCDTVRFYNKVMGTHKFQYTPANPHLYRVVLSLRHQGRNTEYIPIRVAFGAAGLAEEGIPPGTLFLQQPASSSEYDEYERTGQLIVDRAAVECDPRGGDRTPGGTAANDPSLLARFIDRQQAMYYRNRGRANVVGWSIGAASGNGYNMYKSYQWLKDADTRRSVVYEGAEGEWNTDRR